VVDHTLEDMYHAENALTKALPTVIDAVSAQRQRTPSGTIVMDGLVQECESLMKDASDTAANPKANGGTTKARARV